MNRKAKAFRVLWLALFVMFGAEHVVYAKCPMVDWHVTGKVVSARDKAGIDGAQVFVFLDESESTNSAGYGTASPDFFLTAADGSFSATSYFESFRSWSMLSGDECSKKPSLVEVVVVKQGYLTKRKKFPKSEIKLTERKDERTIALPEILLESSPR